MEATVTVGHVEVGGSHVGLPSVPSPPRGRTPSASIVHSLTFAQPALGVGAAPPSGVMPRQHVAVGSPGTDARTGVVRPASSTSWDDAAPGQPAVRITLERDDIDAGRGVGLRVHLVEAVVIIIIVGRDWSCVRERHREGRRGERAETGGVGPAGGVRHGAAVPSVSSDVDAGIHGVELRSRTGTLVLRMGEGEEALVAAYRGAEAGRGRRRHPAGPCNADGLPPH